IEVDGDDSFLAPRIAKLAHGASIDEIIADPDVQRLLVPLREAHEQALDAIQRNAVCEREVVTFELVGLGHDRYNKFIPYWLFPEARYCVAVIVGPSRAKVSVGANPWSETLDDHNIATLCARYGGGGHKVVGAVSLRPDELPLARSIAADIAALLRTPRS